MASRFEDRDSGTNGTRRGGGTAVVRVGLGLLWVVAAVACDKDGHAHTEGHEHAHEDGHAHEHGHAHTEGHAHAHAHGHAHEDGHARAHGHEDGQAGLRLDGERRWTADAATTAGVGRLGTLVTAALARGELDAAALAAAAEGMRGAYKQIFSQCTMTGPAHDQLHLFLVPFVAHFDAMESGDAVKGKAALQALQTQLALYPRYFE